MIDFHCHLDLYPDPREIVAECVSRDIEVLSVTTTPSAWHGTLAVASGARRIRTALGFHPQLALERALELSLFRELLPQTAFVGEIGLDGSPEHAKTLSMQRGIFESVLTACERDGGRIMSIHSRGAATAVMDMLVDHPNAGIPVLHWFSGQPKELLRAIELGCWFSVGPAMLRSKRGQTLSALMPRDRILTETDGPFATIGDVSLRPWQAEEGIEVLAALWNLPASETSQVIRDNLHHLLLGP